VPHSLPLFEELVVVADDPGEFLTRINHALLSILRRTRTPMFASAFYLYIDAATGDLRFVNAGHPKPLHVSRSRGTIELLSETSLRSGAALGVFDEAHYETHATRMDTGDSVLLFTDVLYEVEEPCGEYFDQSRLIDAVRRRLSLPTEQLIDELLKEVQEYAAWQPFLDDVCLVGVEFDHLLRPGTKDEPMELMKVSETARVFS